MRSPLRFHAVRMAISLRVSWRKSISAQLRWQKRRATLGGLELLEVLALVNLL
jgi:hypothetical protein